MGVLVSTFPVSGSYNMYLNNKKKVMKEKWDLVDFSIRLRKGLRVLCRVINRAVQGLEICRDI